MLGVIVNTVTVIIGSLVGLALKTKIPAKLAASAMLAIGLCTLVIGINGVVGADALVMICSMVCGALVGGALDLDGRIQRLGETVERRFSKGRGGAVSLAQGFVSACLLFCVGSLTIVGCLNAGIIGDNFMLFTKALLDLISACMLSATLGLGVLLSAVFVFVLQGALVLLAGVIGPLMVPELRQALVCVGSVLVLALGLNLTGVGKFKVADYLPALVFVPLFWWLIGLLPINL